MNDGGSIILNSSNPNAKGNDGIGVYAAIKAALRSVARTWESELRDRKVRVSVIGPGATETPGIAVLIEERETEVVTVLLQHPCGVRLLLRRAAAPVVGLPEYPLFGLTVASHAELLRWVEHLTTFDVEHSRIHTAHPGWAVTVTGPDLVRIQLQTDEGPNGEDE